MRSIHFTIFSPQLIRLFRQRNKKTTKKANIIAVMRDRLFNKDTSAIEPITESITHSKIKAPELGNIPGTIQQWEMEIKSRVNEIHAWKHRTLLQRIIAKCRRQKIPVSVSGEEIAKFHPIKSALKVVNHLKQHPTDMQKRLELVSIISKSDRNFSIETYRLFLLQSTVACCFGELSNVGVKQVLKNQEVYFAKLLHQCKREADSLKVKLQTRRREKNVYNHQTENVSKHLRDIERNILIIRVYQKQMAKSLKENGMVRPVTLSFDEITALFLQEEKKGRQNKKLQEKKKNTIKNASEILLMIRALPLLQNEAKRFLKHLHKLAPDDPVIAFLEAKVNMSALVFKVGQYQGGERTASVLNAIQETFNITHQQYGVALKKVGNLPKTNIEITIIIEYANLIHYFYKVAKTTLGLPLPREWLNSVFIKTIKLLHLIPDAKQFEQLVADIQKDMADEGIEISSLGV